MSLGFLLLNAAYVIYTASAAFKEILYLRVALLVASLIYIAYGIVEPVWSVAVWNVPVVMLHGYAIWQLVKDRRGIDLNDEAEGIRQLMFPDLDRVRFNQLWWCGQEQVIEDGRLITKGEPVENLFLILDGQVSVDVSPTISVRLGRYRILGEISSLSGSSATATVDAVGSLRVRVWDKAELSTLGGRFPEIHLAMLSAMGKEAARKVV